jgi:hypothetical protein
MKGITIRRQWQAQARTLPLETRQAMLDALRAGKTVGEVREAFDVTLESVCGLIDMNILETKQHSLRRESL